MNNHDAFRVLLSKLLEEKSLSIRKLGKISGIDHATISKIMNGKRKVNVTHLQKLAKVLDVELTTLMNAAGYTIETSKGNDSEIQDSMVAIQKLIKTTTSSDNKEFTIKQVNQEIVIYRDRSQTTEGRKTIIEEFKNKINIVGGKGPQLESLQMMFARFSTKKGTTHELALMGAALLYFIVTTDLIPDYLFAIGLLDDALIVQSISQHIDNKKIL